VGGETDVCELQVYISDLRVRNFVSTNPLVLPISYTILCFALLCFALLCFALLCFAFIAFESLSGRGVCPGIVVLPGGGASASGAST
jgi:hypothetical protein